MKFCIPLLFVAMVAATTGFVDAESSTSTNTDANCRSVCPEVYKPVCGSDGVTYSNKCFLSIAACNNDNKITQASDGECTTTGSSENDASSGCSEVCTRIYKPVCSSDGVTYSNDCVLVVAHCKSGGAITQVSEGECPSSAGKGPEVRSLSAGCPDACLDVYDPVTDENGVQYSNECYLQMAQCKGETGSSTNSSLARDSSNWLSRSLSEDAGAARPRYLRQSTSYSRYSAIDKI